MNLEKELDKYKNMNRDEYFKKNQELAKDLWENQMIPTVGDIAEFIKHDKNENMTSIFNFFDNRNNFIKMVTRQDEAYDEEESATFIQSVMSSNNTDISRAGYFYKLLMASADDFVIVSENCKSEGISLKLSELSKEEYNYRVHYNWIIELDNYVELGYHKFVEKCNQMGLECFHVRTPLSCLSFPKNTEESNTGINKRGICRCCAGKLPNNINNVGTFTTLMVTEHATQTALNSMNEGVQRDINETLTVAYKGGYDWESISNWITSLVQDLKGEDVSSRFYEIALMSRIRFDNEGPYVSSLVGSINRSNNLFGAYIFKPTDKTLESILKKGEFYDNSLKLQIAMNKYSK